MGTVCPTSHSHRHAPTEAEGECVPILILDHDKIYYDCHPQCVAVSSVHEAQILPEHVCNTHAHTHMYYKL